MRKNYFIISLFLLVCTFTSAQEKNNSAQLNELLNRLNAAGNSALPEPDNLFTDSERTILQNHFSKSDGFNNSEMAIGDAYVVNVRVAPRVFGTIPATAAGPYTITPITTFTDAYFAGDFTSAGVLYGFNSVTLSLDIIDIVTGAVTPVAAVTGLTTGHTFTGMSWNLANSTMYVLSTNGTNTTLYTLDLSTAALTTIGNTGNPQGIWLAINNTGGAYVADISNDNLYAVNLTTGVATLVGALGLNIAFAQDADFDSSTGILYMGAYIGAGVNQYCSVNTTTGAVTQLGTVNANAAELEILAIYRGILNVNEVNLETAISVFPNPSNGIVNIVNNQNIAVEKATIFDMGGRMVKEINLENSVEQTINIADLSSGVYTISIQTQSGKVSKKLAKR